VAAHIGSRPYTAVVGHALAQAEGEQLRSMILQRLPQVRDMYFGPVSPVVAVASRDAGRYHGPRSQLKHKHLERGKRFPCPTCGGTCVSTLHNPRIADARILAGQDIIDYHGAYMSRIDQWLPGTSRSILHKDKFEQKEAWLTNQMSAHFHKLRQSDERLKLLDEQIAKSRTRALESSPVEFECDSCKVLVSEEAMVCPGCGTEFDEREIVRQRMLEGGTPALSGEQLAQLSPQQLDTLQAYEPLLDPEQAKAVAAATKVVNDIQTVI